MIHAPLAPLLPARAGMELLDRPPAQGIRRADTHAGRRQPRCPPLGGQGALVGMLSPRIEAHDAIGAGAHTLLAARAALGVDGHDPVTRALTDGAGSARAHARRPLALLAHGLDELEALGVVGTGEGEDARTELAGAETMLELASRLAGPAADAAGEIDHQRELSHVLVVFLAAVYTG